MPFKSEKQRKYLWANEPKIARDWTDTYGSRIHKNDGGISQLVQPGPGRPGYGGPQDWGQQEAKTGAYSPSSKGSYVMSGGTKHHQGSGEYNRQVASTKARVAKNREETIRQQKAKDLGYFTKASYINRSLSPTFKGSIMPNKTQDFLKAALDNEEQSLLGFDGHSGLSGKQLSKQSQMLDKLEAVGVKDLGDINQLSQKDFETLMPDWQKNPGGDGGGGDGGQVPWWLRQQAPAASTPDATTTASTLGSGHFQVPIDYVQNQTRAAEGGRIGYQMGNMVEGEMEGAEMEGAVMQSKEVIKELYDALIAQGLSPQEAMEKIKEMIASSQTQEPQSPMMGEEFPGQEFGRAPAAFGGIMDTYTGRRKYGLGSFFKKATKKLKKLAGSKLGKIALGYIATAGLSNYLAGAGGVGAAGGQGWQSMKWLKPSLLKQNLGTNVGSISNLFSSPATKKVVEEGGKKTAGDWSKWILPASVGIGALSAKMPVEELDDVQGEWDEDKAKFDAYLASLDTGDSYRVPKEYTLAQGGRIGADEGGLMNLGGMEKDYRNDGGFVPLGGEEKADDVPARLSKNEFVFTADAVRSAGGGDIDKGAQVMENVMKNLEGGGQISEESQGQGAQEMFETSERLSEVI